VEAHWPGSMAGPVLWYFSHFAKLVEVTFGAPPSPAGRDWKQRAACAGFQSTFFFPGVDSSPATVAQALAVCEQCPVRVDCLEYAFETNQVAGIWGGTTEEERRSLRRKWLASRRKTA
jgi:WhiB family transcriptional regulator, redox-sensing transcriptional regulator